MKCLRKYQWVKLPRDIPDMGKGLMAYWAMLAFRAAFRKGNASYCGHSNPVAPGMWAGGVVGLKSIDRTAPRCPYCGSHTILRSADGIYRENARNDMLYVCKNYPVCDSYVRVQRGTKIPLGTVANRELRELRAEAHRQFDKLYKHGYMSKHDAYQWLGGILSVPAKQAHIAQLSLLSCNLVIREAKKQVNWYHIHLRLGQSCQCQLLP